MLTGAGDVFCLGGDWRGAAPPTPGATSTPALLAMDLAMAQLGKPLVAAVNGDAHAGGFATVVACDLAVAADDATLGLPEAAAGLFPFIALATVKDALPKKLLFDLIYRARLMPATEALAAHLVNEIVPRGTVLERAIAIAEQAAAHRPRDRRARPRSLLQNTRIASGGSPGRGPSTSARRSRGRGPILSPLSRAIDALEGYFNGCSLVWSGWSRRGGPVLLDLQGGTHGHLRQDIAVPVVRRSGRSSQEKYSHGLKLKLENLEEEQGPAAAET